MLSALVLAIVLLFWAAPMLNVATPFGLRSNARLPPSVWALPTLESVLE